jgi:hypothetical protein
LIGLARRNDDSQATADDPPPAFFVETFRAASGKAQP